MGAALALDWSNCTDSTRACLPRFISMTVVTDADEDGDPLVCKTGQIFDGYEIVGFIGSGGTCQVYEARHAIMGRRVAIKVQKAHLRANSQRSHRIAQEARALAAIDHPNIIRVHHVNDDPRCGIFIVQDFLVGQDLRRILWDLARRGARLSIREAGATIIEVSEGVGAVHSKKIVHRDIKPDNIFLHNKPSGERVVILLDFGAIKVTEGGVPRTTDRNLAIGTLPYMPPEQLAGKATLRSDIYALALVFDEMVSGAHPFSPGSGVLDPQARESIIRARILQGLYDPLHERVPGFPRKISSFVGRCLSPDPSLRPGSVEDFRSELRTLIRELPRAPKSDEVATSAAPAPTRAPVVAPVQVAAKPVAGGSPRSLARRGTQPLVEEPSSPAPPPAPPRKGTRPIILPGSVALQQPAPMRPAQPEKPAEVARATVVPLDSLPPFATSHASKLDVPSLLLVEAPGVWNFLRIPLDFLPSENAAVRGALSVGGGEADIPLPGVTTFTLWEDAERSVWVSGVRTDALDLRKPLSPYATFTVAACTFMFVPPTPDGLGIPPNYAAITVSKEANLALPSFAVRAGHPLAWSRRFPVQPLMRLGGLVDLEMPLFGSRIPHVATLRWDPNHEAFEVTPEVQGVVHLFGNRAELGYLSIEGAIKADGWDLVLQQATFRRTP